MLFHVCVCAKSLQSCPTLCNPMDHSPAGSSVHGILQARILEWASSPFSRGSSQPRDCTCISMPPALAGGLFTTSFTWKAHGHPELTSGHCSALQRGSSSIHQNTDTSSPNQETLTSRWSNPTHRSRRHNKYMLDFPGNPMVKTLCSQFRGHGFTPGRGTNIPHASGLANIYKYTCICIYRY